MSLSSAGAIALRSLGVVSDQMSVASRNIAGAGVAGVSRKTALLVSDEAGADVVGVGRATDAALFRNLLSATAQQGTAGAVSDALGRLDLALGLSDSATSRSPAALVTKLRDALQTYSATPNDPTAGQMALSAAQDTVGALVDAATATQDERRQADQAMAEGVADVNRLLDEFGTLNESIVRATAAGQDATDSLDRRDGVLAEIAKLIGVSVVGRPNNDMVLYTDSGATLFETTARKLTFQETPNLSAGVNGASVYIDGVRVTGAGAPLPLQSGALVGLARIRDDIAPQYQSQLDEIARGLVVAFAEKDQSGGGGAPLPGLFTYAGATTAPAATLIPGLAGQIAVAAAVDPLQGGALARLRDGGISGNPAYVYNPTGAPAYADRLIELTNAAAAAQGFDPAAGLGAAASLATYAANSNGWIAAQRQQIDGAATYYDAVVSQTTQALSNVAGVNLDEQMSQMLALENSYQASAKLLQIVNAMFDRLFAAIQA